MSTQTADSGIPADTFESRLYIARFHAGRLSAAEAGRRVGVSHTTWANWEKGINTPLNKPSMVAFIARELGVDEEWLRRGGPLRRDPQGGLRLISAEPSEGPVQPTDCTPRRGALRLVA